MKTIRTHKLQIAGQPLTVRSGADARYVQALAERVETRTQAAMDQGAGPAGAALLAALALADELHRLEEEISTLRAALGDRVDALRAATT